MLIIKTFTSSYFSKIKNLKKMFSEIGMYHTKVDICNNILLHILRLSSVLRVNQMISKLVLKFRT